MATTFAVRCPRKGEKDYRIVRWFDSSEQGSFDGTKWHLAEPPASIQKGLGYIHAVDAPSRSRLLPTFRDAPGPVYFERPASWICEEIEREGEATVAWGDLKITVPE